MGYTDPVPGDLDAFKMLGERFVHNRRLSVATPSGPGPLDPSSTNYVDMLKRSATRLRESTKGLTATSVALCERLLHTTQTVPKRDEFLPTRLAAFEQTITGASLEAIVEELTLMVVPFVSACNDGTNAPGNSELLIEAMQSEWQSSISGIGVRPKPFFSVGFLGSAFTPAQRAMIVGCGVTDANSPAVVSARNMMVCPFSLLRQ